MEGLGVELQAFRSKVQQFNQYTTASLLIRIRTLISKIALKEELLIDMGRLLDEGGYIKSLR